MNILSTFRDPARKQINALSKDLPKWARKNLKKCLYKDSAKVKFFFNVWASHAYDPQVNPILVKICTAALQPGHQGRREAAINRFGTLSGGFSFTNQRWLDFLKPQREIISAPLRDCLLDRSLRPLARSKCADILEELEDTDFIAPLRDCLSDESLTPLHKSQFAAILARKGDQNAIGPIRSLLGSLETIGSFSVPSWLEACY
jgi:hypothetical protein